MRGPQILFRVEAANFCPSPGVRPAPRTHHGPAPGALTQLQIAGTHFLTPAACRSAVSKLRQRSMVLGKRAPSGLHGLKATTPLPGSLETSAREWEMALYVGGRPRYPGLFFLNCFLLISPACCYWENRNSVYNIYIPRCYHKIPRACPFKINATKEKPPRGVHARTHYRGHTRTRGHTHAHTLGTRLTHAHAHTHSGHTRLGTHTRTHTRGHAHTHTHTHTLGTHTALRGHTRTRGHVHSRDTHALGTRALPGTHTHAHTHPGTHTRTRTHALSGTHALPGTRPHAC